MHMHALALQVFAINKIIMNEWWIDNGISDIVSTYFGMNVQGHSIFS